MQLRIQNSQKPISQGFTLIELLVVVAIIIVLVAILVPSLAQARRQAKTAKCLANVRGMEMAHWMYMTENNGLFIQAGLSHGGHAIAGGVGWIDTLQQYYSNSLLYRCPEDVSPYWPAEQGGSGQTVGGNVRKTSFGINGYLDRDMSANNISLGGTSYTKLTQVPAPQAIVQFLEMTQIGLWNNEFVVADHPHVENWNLPPDAPTNAANEVQINQHGGPERSWKSRANWGFLDGHAETLTFREVYRSHQDNNFNPKLGQ